MEKKLRQGTLCVQAGYKAKNGEPILVTDPDLRSGHLEMSNADVAEEYAKMIEGSRAYSYALKMVRTADEVDQTINSLRA